MQALQRCSGLLNRRARCESVATHQFQRSRSSKYQSATLRTSWLQVRVLPGVPFRRVSPTTRDAPLRTERFWVEIPHAAPIVGPAPAALVVQCRDGALKTRTVSVQLRPWAPAACSPMKRRPAQTGKVAGASPATRTIFGMSTGQASRASVLTSACLIRACGASPRHSASLCRWPPQRA